MSILIALFVVIIGFVAWCVYLYNINKQFSKAIENIVEPKTWQLLSQEFKEHTNRIQESGFMFISLSVTIAIMLCLFFG